MINREAREQFAAANGWRIAEHGFGMSVLARGGVHGRGLYDGLPDHPEWYRKDRRAVAIVGHNYPGPENGDEFLGRTLTGGVEVDPLFFPGGGNHYGVATLAREAGALGLVTHVAPGGAAASWYYPNHSILIVVTRPGIEIVWPTPKQMVKNGAEYAIYNERRRVADKRPLSTAEV